MDRENWNDEKIADGIEEVIRFNELCRMPTYAEIREYYNNDKLTNAISKHGGIEKYSEILRMPQKNSATAAGQKWEKICKTELEGRGYSVELTSCRFPYDLLVNGNVKIDVKYGRPVFTDGVPYYTFNLAKKKQTCDFYIALAVDEEIYKAYVIPSNLMTGKKQLSIGYGESAYDVYLERYDLIEKLNLAFEEVKHG